MAPDSGCFGENPRPPWWGSGLQEPFRERGTTAPTSLGGQDQTSHSLSGLEGLPGTEDWSLQINTVVKEGAARGRAPQDSWPATAHGVKGL